MENELEPISLKENMIWNSAGSFTYLICTWLTTVLVVRLSNTYSDSGVLAVAMAVGNITSTIVFFKTRPVQVGCSEKEYTASDFVGFKIICSLAGLVISLTYSIFTVESINYPTVFVYIIFKVFETFVDVYHGIFQRNGRLDYAGKSQIYRGIGILVTFVFGLAVFHSLLVSVGLMTLSTISVVFLYDARKARLYTSIRPVFSGYKIKNLTFSCLPGFLSCFLLSYVVSQTRQSFALGYGNEALGVYAAVATPTVVVQAVANYLYAPLYEPISRSYHNKDKKWLSNLLIKIIAIIISICVAGIMASACLGEFALSVLYSPNISSHAHLLYGALAAASANACITFLVDVLVLFGDRGGTIAASLIPTVVSIILSNIMLSSDPNTISIVIFISYIMGIIASLSRIKIAIGR